ncbi:nucleolin-like isoform X1 [Tripterygium wilfordii]|uniref:nucleolin-like isoform X1 n=1 Tax=Tripterygium wilfordii TaxID=458696 RepID=UPI0018F82C25|nr:nucleolin-like isoform X1 [Tripterygium wilfordii]
MPPKKKPQPPGPRPRRSLRTAARRAAAESAALAASKEDTEKAPEVAVPLSESGSETCRINEEDDGEMTTVTTDSAPESAVLDSPIGTESASADANCGDGGSAIGDGSTQKRSCEEGGQADRIERLSGDEIREEKVEQSGAEAGTLGTAIGDSACGGGGTSPRDDVVAERVEAENGVMKKKKKVVKIVRKLVKKRVSKGVEKGMTACWSEELERHQVFGDTNATSLMAVEKPNLAVDGAEDPNSLTDGSVEVRKSNLAVDGVENLKSHTYGSMEVKKPNIAVDGAQDPADDSMEVEKLNLLEDIAENSNSAADGSMEGKECSVAEMPLQPENNVNVVVKPTTVTEVPEERPNLDLLSENCEYGAMCKELGGGAEEGVNEEGEKGDDVNLTAEGKTGTVGIALSGELEALERRKRRQTEIFIGGLDKDTNEEEIRKVFEDSGKIVEVRLLINGKTGKNKGYGFVRFSSAADAKRALEKHPRVKICGKQCSPAPVEGNDTLFLGNIDKKWKNEDVIKLLQNIGIEKIDKVTVIADPNNIERNRGFAFVELESNKDAQIAYKILQTNDMPGKLQNIKVAWAEPLSEPDEEEMLKVKSVYVEYLPSSWNEEKIRSYFEKFGEIENVVLSRNLRSSRRKDFAFVKFATREAALACIESFNQETLSDEGSKVHVKVSLAKPQPKNKLHQKVSKTIRTEVISKQKPTVTQYEPRNKSISSIHQNINTLDNRRSSAEVERLLAERASFRQFQSRFDTGSPIVGDSYSLPGRKRPPPTFGDNLYNTEPRGYPRMRLESSFPVASPSYSTYASGVGVTSLSHQQQQGTGYRLGFGRLDYANGFQNEQAPYLGRNSPHYRYQQQPFNTDR